ncbi:GNAT family N-acetyltransferase [Shewanella sp. 10N.286.51.B7]|uniref:GNAT family N-acetyltransferase n=1 Tax=Shewanella electrodiphila TaxID=934143 RepID=A0ABT0KPM2_9GAMM|nr:MULTISPECIES: GNAT family N-acetyltransferase [Shewanella]MCC4832399.1 GNAT family N-acetyltransferase [Shewanella sp. 10N.7]MCL1045796.1 GNAT family N-acetyltransferase [Shewanella electrodiphila]PMG75922.1 GNAT family N-acetyltransferase [Shewanella sp. 10N.286.51.B7]
MKIIQATIEQLNLVTTLFDEYRQFYGQAANIEQCKKFIKERLIESDSVIFIATNEEGEGLGFVQLYPTFSSVAMKRMWILNDMFVATAARQQGVANKLLKQVDLFAQYTDASTVKLATAVDNDVAKALYESLGYTKTTAFDHYTKAF